MESPMKPWILMPVSKERQRELREARKVVGFRGDTVIPVIPDTVIPDTSVSLIPDTVIPDVAIVTGKQIGRAHV